MGYEDLIRTTIAKQGRTGYDVREIEAWLREQHPTLDGLTASQFGYEVEAACRLIDADPDLSRRLADSLGL